MNCNLFQLPSISELNSEEVHHDLVELIHLDLNPLKVEVHFVSTNNFMFSYVIVNICRFEIYLLSVEFLNVKYRVICGN